MTVDSQGDSKVTQVLRTRPDWIHRSRVARTGAVLASEGTCWQALCLSADGLVCDQIAPPRSPGGKAAPGSSIGMSLRDGSRLSDASRAIRLWG